MLRIGHGYDIHRVIAGRPLVLGGVPFATDFGLDGHSDADCVTHAICDALLGAAGLPDIGHYFPNTDPAWKGIDSQVLLRRVIAELKSRHYSPVNIDVTVLAEKPKIAPHLPAIKAILAQSTGLPADAIGIKATTHEQVDDIGRGAAIAAHAVALIEKKLAVRIVAALSLAAIFLSGCLRRETVVQRGDREQVLHRGIGYEVVGLDPQLVTGTAEQAVVSAVFEGLVAEDPRDLHPVPGVAARWEVSPDGLTYTFHLRPDARWSDGLPVTAGDFTASWQRILSPSLGAPNASLLYLLQGAEAFNKGLTKDFSQVGVSAPDSRTLRVTLEHPAPYFLMLLTHWCWYPVPTAVIARYGPLDAPGNPWTRPGHLVGNGPFVLKSWVPDKVIVVEKSTTYWDAPQVRLQAIHFYPLDNLDAEERAFRAGQLHLTDALPVSRLDAYRREAPQFLRIDPYLGTYFYRFNTRRPYLDDVRIRQALALAVDRRAIVGRILQGGQTAAGTFTPPGVDGYVPPAGLTTDFAGARQLLAQAGHPGGKGLPPFELLYNNSENHRLIAEAIQEMWRRELGIEVRLVNQEQKVVLAERQTGDYQILRSDWIADYADPSSFLDIWRGDSSNNYTGWSNPDYDTLLFSAARTADPAARQALLQKAESLLLEGAPIIPLYHYTHVFLIQPSVQGWYSTPLDHHPYKYVWLEEPKPAG